MSIEVTYDCPVCRKSKSTDRDDPVCMPCYEAKESELEHSEEQVSNLDSELEAAGMEIQRLRGLVTQLKAIMEQCPTCGGTLAAQNL